MTLKHEVAGVPALFAKEVSVERDLELYSASPQRILTYPVSGSSRNLAISVVLFDNIKGRSLLC